MTDHYILIDYTIKNGVFEGTIRPEDGWVPRVMILKDPKRNKIFRDVIINRSEEGLYDFTFNMDDADISVGVWYPILIDMEGEEHFLQYRDVKNNKGVGRLLELSMTKLEINPEKKQHYMGALDPESVFVVRKWRQKSDVVKKFPTFITKFTVKDLEVTFKIRRKHDKKIEQAELWMWSRALKQVHRITLDPEQVRDKKFTVPLESFVKEFSESFTRLWEVFLVMNMDGSYCVSRLEQRTKTGGSQAKINHTAFDERSRYVISHPLTDHKGEYEWVFQLYFDQLSLCCGKIVPRELMYKGMLRGKIKDFKVKKSVLRLKLYCDSENGFEERKLLLRQKPEDETGGAREYEFTKEHQVINETAGHVITVFSIDYDGIIWDCLRYEVILLVKQDNYWYELRVMGMGSEFYKRIGKMYKYSYTTNDDILVYLSETISSKIVVESRKRTIYDNKKYQRNEKIAIILYSLLHAFFNRKANLLFYEKFCTSAQDNSFYMFDYFMNHVDETIRPLYIIEKKQADFIKLRHIYHGNVIPFMSIRHLIYIQAATMFISTDSKRHCYRWRSGNTPIMQIINQKKFAFLQHGVLGFKRVESIYGKQFSNRADIFVASSEFERDIIVRNFGYDEKEIIITGLARWDYLKQRDLDNPMIFYMPTWRNWIYEVEEQAFIDTDYYKQYSKIIQSEQLAQILEKNNIDLVFCLHPKFRQFTHCMKTECSRIKIFNFEDCKINELIMSCNAFITDYSSASWDVYYLNKPVIFYQFDTEKYMEKQGSYINLESELFGTRVVDYSQFIHEIQCLIDSGFRSKETNELMRKKYLPIQDQKHRKHIYNEIIKRLP